MAKKKKHTSGVVANKRAFFDYTISQPLVAGIALTGPEVRSIRSSHASLVGAFVTIKDGEAYLLNAQVMPLKTNAAHLPSEMQIRTRKLLLKKRQLEDLAQAKQQGYTIIPLKILTKGKFIKVEIALAKGKRQYDKRESIKKRDTARDIARNI
ncbi:MAG: SsrA-binding protein [Candidatus Saccharibacteria bacterium]|nr:SsrA-binding protein [Candidatus Saccharibacteria bacterium]